MDNARFRFLFQRYIEQNCTEDERLEFFGLIQSSKHDESLKALMDTLWQADFQLPLTKEKADSIFNLIVNNGTAHQIAVRRIKPAYTLNSLAFWRMAAAIALLIMGSLSAYFILGSDDASEYQSGVSKERIEKTGEEHMLVLLPDGSKVILNAGSRLDYSGSFETSREVMLTGEGYFDIVHDPSRPFVVNTGSLKTTVLGTAFNIRAYDGDGDIIVTVTRGKVKVSKEGRDIGVILPDEQITFDGKSRKSEKKAVDSQKAIAWTENDIFFNELTLAEAARQLEDRFKVKIEFGDEKLKTCRFTATFIQNESVDQILEVICEFNNASYRKRNDGTITISGDGC